MSILSDIGKKLKEFVKNTFKFEKLDKQDFVEIMDNTLEYLQDILDVKKIMPLDVQKDVLTKYYRNYPSFMSKDKSAELFELYTKQLGGKGKSINMKTNEFATIFEVTKKYKKILEMAKKNIDKLIVDKEITIFNTKVSHLAFIGLLEQAEFFAKYSTFLITGVFNISREADRIAPGYRTKFLVDNFKTYLELIDIVLNRSDKYRFLDEVDSVKKKNINFNIVSGEDQTTFDSFTKSNDFSRGFSSMMSFGIIGLNWFASLISVFDDINHAKYQKNKQTKEWLEAHVALLSMEKEGISPDDKRYRQLEKSIQIYSDQITEYDSKIRKYKGER